MKKAMLAAAAVLSFPGFAVAGVTRPPIDIPEPATLALLAAGMGALALMKFRRRR